MTTLKLAREEFNRTSPLLKPHLCKDKLTGKYFVTLVFSKEFCIKKGFKVLK